MVNVPGFMEIDQMLGGCIYTIIEYVERFSRLLIGIECCAKVLGYHHGTSIRNSDIPHT